MESLVCGKPVIVSRSIPMSDFVEESNSVVVIEEFSLPALKKGLTHFIQRYEYFSQRAHEIHPSHFDQTNLVAQFEQIYQQVAL